MAISLAHPVWGPTRVSDRLRLEAVAVSPGTIRNIWIKEDLETRYKRLLRLVSHKKLNTTTNE